MAKEFKIFNVEVDGMRSAILASRYPMQVDPTNWTYDLDWVAEHEAVEKQKPMAIRLSETASKTHLPHDCFLKGITVKLDVTYPGYWDMQRARYHFIDIVSSTSKMHRLSTSKISECCNHWTDPRSIEIAEEWQKKYLEDKTEENFMCLLNSLPYGFMLTYRLVTNYLQLKTIYRQRHNHRLPEWRAFCDWIKSLPMMDDFLKEEMES